MSLFDPLLVPLDGSPLAAGAAEAARTVAAGTGDTTLLLHVIEPGGPGWSTDAEMNAMMAAEHGLRGEAARFTSPADVRVVTGEPADAICRAAVDFGAGLLVLTPRGRGALASVLLGSVSRELLVACRSSMLVVHGPIVRGAPVVCGVDAGPASGNVVVAARTLAGALGSPLHVVHVVNADPAVARRPEQFNIDPVRWRAAVDRAVERAFAPVREEYPVGTVEEVRFGVVAEELGRYAEAHGATVIAVGRKGESGSEMSSFFSVAFGVATRGGCSALIV